MKHLLASLLAFSFALTALAQDTHTLSSPDGRIEVQVSTQDRISYDVSFDGKPLMEESTLSMTVAGRALGQAPRVVDVDSRQVDQVIDVPVPLKHSTLREAYSELTLRFDGNYAVTFRAYDEGVAYRFETSFVGVNLTVDDESAEFRFAGEPDIFFPTEPGFFSDNERHFIRYRLADLTADSLGSIPAVVDVDGIKIALSDSDLADYPGLWFRGTGSNSLTAAFPPYPLEEEHPWDRVFIVSEAADHIAVVDGSRTFPWRGMAIAERDIDLLDNSLVYLLASPSEIDDPSWIQAGKVAWDWYNFSNLYGVDFRAGVNNETYRYFIDFASRFGIEYVILDEGWYELGDLLAVSPEIDVPGLVEYGRERGVGIILWVVSKTLDDQLEEGFDQFAEWGVKGVKVDFMQRDDQLIIEYYQRVNKAAAERQLLVNYHGAGRPAIMARTWPNIVGVEGVIGLEYNKWSAQAHPDHNVTIPFTRMLLGPMDYTPGAMLNAQEEDYAPVHRRPMSLGTRMHQLAMYVIYESPMQMLADSPSNYLSEVEMMDFLAPVPAVWDETVPLAGEIGEYVVMARRTGDEWYVGAMTNWSEREIEIDLSFLPPGTFTLDAFEDGINADRYAGDYRRRSASVSSSDVLTVRLAPGGGFAARITP